MAASRTTVPRSDSAADDNSRKQIDVRCTKNKIRRPMQKITNFGQVCAHGLNFSRDFMVKTTPSSPTLPFSPVLFELTGSMVEKLAHAQRACEVSADRHQSDR